VCVNDVTVTAAQKNNQTLTHTFVMFYTLVNLKSGSGSGSGRICHTKSGSGQIGKK